MKQVLSYIHVCMCEAKIYLERAIRTRSGGLSSRIRVYSGKTKDTCSFLSPLYLPLISMKTYLGLIRNNKIKLNLHIIYYLIAKCVINLTFYRIMKDLSQVSKIPISKRNYSTLVTRCKSLSPTSKLLHHLHPR